MIKRHTRSEYLSAVQEEYISSFIRFVTYTRPEDVKKYGDICRMKAEKIKDVAFKEKMNSIFSSRSLLDKYLNKCLNSSGLPSFKYKNDDQKKRLSYWDRFYFFAEGSSVKFDGEIYTVDKNSTKTETLEICNGDDIIVVPYSDVERVIREDIIARFTLPK